MGFTYNLPLLDNGVFGTLPGMGKLFGMITDPATYASSFLSSTPFFIFQLALFAFTVIFFVGIVFLIMKINEISRKTQKEVARRRIRLQKTKSPRWNVVENHLQSDNPAEWKLAIIEADSMLDELVKKLGYPGSTLGEMMKQIEKSDFTTLDDAWEAHKVRNYIAHQGSTFLLSKHQATHVIRLYEKVFKEFEYI